MQRTGLGWLLPGPVSMWWAFQNGDLSLAIVKKKKRPHICIFQRIGIGPVPSLEGLIDKLAPFLPLIIIHSSLTVMIWPLSTIGLNPIKRKLIKSLKLRPNQGLEKSHQSHIWQTEIHIISFSFSLWIINIVLGGPIQTKRTFRKYWLFINLI